GDGPLHVVGRGRQDGRLRQHDVLGGGVLLLAGGGDELVGQRHLRGVRGLLEVGGVGGLDPGPGRLELGAGGGGLLLGRRGERRFRRGCHRAPQGQNADGGQNVLLGHVGTCGDAAGRDVPADGPCSRTATRVQQRSTPPGRAAGRFSFAGV